MAIIYESPDKGQTIYAREMNQPHRVLIKSGEVENILDLGRKYLDIKKTAETNPSLKKALEEMELIYGLTKKY